MEIYVDDIRNYTDDEYLKILHQLPEDEYGYIDSKLLKEEKQRTLLGWLLLKKHTGCNLEKIIRGKYGKPYIPGYFFNISHQRNFVAVVISDREVGIKLITFKSGNFNDTYLFACKDEREYIDTYQYRFCDVYAQKAAFGKCIGIGNKSLFKYNLLNAEHLTVLKRVTDDYSLAVCELGD